VPKGPQESTGSFQVSTGESHVPFWKNWRLSLRRNSQLLPTTSFSGHSKPPGRKDGKATNAVNYLQLLPWELPLNCPNRSCGHSRLVDPDLLTRCAKDCSPGGAVREETDVRRAECKLVPNWPLSQVLLPLAGEGKLHKGKRGFPIVYQKELRIWKERGKSPSRPYVVLKS